ncbi:MAG: hypothetical protein HQM09_04230 [Candidatus Riflebacteria bacterium]|nr:hypothetical protein [Candidatus Riflebacteria bacterium]
MIKQERLRNGIALGVAIFILFVLFAAGMTISHLMHGLQRQVEYADSAVRAQYIGESGLNQLLARLQAKPWEERWFAKSPDAASDINYSGGSYDYFISDSPNHPMHVDIWIKSNYRNTKRFFFWRVKFQSSMLSGLAQGIPVKIAELDSSDFPPPGTTDFYPMTSQIENQLETQKSNRGPADDITQSLRDTNDLHQAMSKLGGPADGVFVAGPFVSGIGTAAVSLITPPPPPPPSTGGLAIPPALPLTISVPSAEAEFVSAPLRIISQIDDGADISGHGWDLVDVINNNGHVMMPFQWPMIHHFHDHGFADFIGKIMGGFGFDDHDHDDHDDHDDYSGHYDRDGHSGH